MGPGHCADPIPSTGAVCPPHPTSFPAGRWGWLPACGCWSSWPSACTSPPPASSTSGEGNTVLPGDGMGSVPCSHPVSPTVSWGPRSPSACGTMPRTSRWQMWPTGLVSAQVGDPSSYTPVSPLLQGLRGGVGLRSSHHTSQCCWLSCGPGAWWAALGVFSYSWSFLGQRKHPTDCLSPSAEQMKAELEAELGLKIVQTGVGEVGP